jgi:hypothetical protein
VKLWLAGFLFRAAARLTRLRPISTKSEWYIAQLRSSDFHIEGYRLATMTISAAVSQKELDDLEALHVKGTLIRVAGRAL